MQKKVCKKHGKERNRGTDDTGYTGRQISKTHVKKRIWNRKHEKRKHNHFYSIAFFETKFFKKWHSIVFFHEKNKGNEKYPTQKKPQPGKQKNAESVIHAQFQRVKSGCPHQANQNVINDVFSGHRVKIIRLEEISIQPLGISELIQIETQSKPDSG